MRNKNKNRIYYGASTAFLDLLFNSLLGFVALFFLAFILINPKVVSDAKVKAKAEFMITIEWAEESLDDVDAYLEDPLGNLVFFNRREDGLMHLDRDDLGARSDYIYTEDGNWIVVKDNREIITIRGIIPGEYVMNIHMYKKRDSTPTKVKVRIEKLNPQVRNVAQREVTLMANGDEKTIARFTLDKEGDVTNTNEIPKKLAKVHESDDDERDYYDEGDS